MTKQVFVKLAAEFAALKVDHDAESTNVWSTAKSYAKTMRVNCARRVASVCQEVTPLFDRARFLKACEVEE